MDYYLDICTKPDAEMRQNLLLNMVYTKLHKELFDRKATDIGVSFPEYRVLLGGVIRLHSTQQKLQSLYESDWLGGLSGYCKLIGVRRVPTDVKYRTISRVQSTMTESKLRRLVKRGSITDDDVREYRAKMFANGLDNPYLELQSISTGHKHRRYLAFGSLQEAPTAGEFDQFGLSKTATIPWF